MIITDLGSNIKITFDVGSVTYAKSEVVGIKTSTSQETIKLIVISGGLNGKVYTVIKYADITSPSYATFAEFVTWFENMIDNSVATILYTATSVDEAAGTIDLSANSASLTINAVMQNSSFLNPAQYSFNSTTKVLTFVGGITDGDYILVYVNL